MKKRRFISTGRGVAAVLWGLGLMLVPGVHATDFTSVADGDWATATTWSPNGNPNPGTLQGNAGTDNVTINGHDITVDQDTYGTGDGATDRFTVRGGHSVTINGGSLTTAAGDGSIVIGNVDTGTVNVNDGTMTYNGGGATYVGYAGGTGNLNVGDGVGAAGSAVYDNTGALLRLGGTSGSSGTGVVTIKSDGSILNSRAVVGDNAGTTGTMTLTGAGQYQTTGGTAINYVGLRGDGTLNIGGNSTFTWRGTRRFAVGGVGAGSEGTINVTGGTLLGTGNQGTSTDGLVIGDQGTGHLNVSGGGNVDIGSSLTIGGVAGAGTGFINQTGGSISAQNVFLGRHTGNNGTYTMSGGTLNVSARIGPGLAGNGTFNQTGGDVSTPRINFSEAGGGNGTYILNGGTLRTDVIDENFGNTAEPDGVFQWGNGTLTMRSVSGSSGGTDYTLNPAVGGGEALVRSGTTLTVEGDIATGYLGGSSTLDLGGLYINNGTRVNILNVVGALDLSAADDTLLTIDSPGLLRPSGVNTLDWGTIPLVTASGGITGQFDNLLMPNPDVGYFVFMNGITDPTLLKPNSYSFEYTGTQLLFHYKVSGNVPEPHTVSFIVLGVAILRFSRWTLSGKNKTASQAS